LHLDVSVQTTPTHDDNPEPFFCVAKAWPRKSRALPGYEASGWQGVGAPKKNTPTEIITKLNSEINAAFADPKLKARLANLGGTVLSGSPADFGKLIADETDKWGKVIRAANIKPE
jgi:tripartite-type tricarboxylate transporter receptor subunit TctC